MYLLAQGAEAVRGHQHLGYREQYSDMTRIYIFLYVTEKREQSGRGKMPDAGKYDLLLQIPAVTYVIRIKVRRASLFYVRIIATMIRFNVSAGDIPPKSLFAYRN